MINNARWDQVNNEDKFLNFTGFSKGFNVKYLDTHVPCHYGTQNQISGFFFFFFLIYLGHFHDTFDNGTIFGPGIYQT